MNRSPKSEVRSPQVPAALTSLLVMLAGVLVAPGADPPTDLVADRAAIERVYYQHRLGDKPPFEQVLPREALERLVRDDLRKEAALKKAYGVAVTPAMLAAELQRINLTTRAPDILAELKAALGNDTNLFARTVAKAIVVEHLLREKFDNDDTLHAPQRREVEQVRAELLAEKPVESVAASRQSAAITPSANGDSSARKSAALSRDAATSKPLAERRLVLLKQTRSNAVTETTWQLGARPEVKPGAENADQMEIRKRFGPNAQILSSPHSGDKERKFYFEDLPGELQRVLHAQLRQPGDVSAVIEMPGGFLLYVCQEKTGETLSVATLSLPKRSYEQWLAEQTP